jgi:superfamily II DNA/RNA helicase
MDDFHSGRAKTLVATDIAARGIHVDDVALVVHADPPVEHKAYLHRSGRTARAGAAGTVVTMMLDEQVRDVRDLTRKAGIKPTTTRVATGHPLLSELAPGERSYAGGLVREEVPSGAASGRGRGGRKGSTASRGGQNGRSAAAVSDSGRGSTGGRGRGARGGAATTSGSRRSGSGRAAGAGRRAGSSTFYSTSSGSGSAAAFSAGSRAGARRSSR